MRLRKETDRTEDMLAEEILLIANVSDALAHPARVELFRFIMQSNKAMIDVCNRDLVASFDYAQATISQHMKKLVESGLVEIKPQGKYTFYYANLGMLSRYLNATRKFAVT
ncbi:MAG: winged helix-turn-helix transcriptional regulator [Firmicutes bacterium]|jgi:ArsR family transcriptional regulator|nr:winged helix-turn-helix transcriptional regulator [Bacillota bacterium]